MSNDLSAQPVTFDTTDLATFDIMGAALVERGIMTAEAVTAERAAKEAGDMGANNGASPAPVPPVLYDGETSSLDAGIFQGAKHQAEYNFAGSRPPHVDASDPNYAKFDTALRQGFIEARLPAAIGNELGRLIASQMSRPAMQPYEVETMRQSSVAQLKQMWGADFDRNILAARAVVESMGPAKALVKAILADGLGANAWVAATLFNVAQARGLVR